LPEPRRTRKSASPTFPAGSVAVIVMWFVPARIGRLSVNVPSASACPDTGRLVRLIARDEGRPRLRRALDLDRLAVDLRVVLREVIFTRGLELSRT
jgi:hypothetical protein